MTALFETTVARYTARLQADLGIKGFQADGVFGNIGHECDGFTALQERAPASGQGGYGWEQWTGPRRRTYLAFCSAQSRDPAAAESNYLFLVHESRTDELASLQALRATRTRDEAVAVWMEKNERPGVPALANRIAWAVRAEAARLAQEALTAAETSSQKGQSMPEASPAAPAPAPAGGLAASPAPAPAPASDPIVDAIARMEQKLEDLAAAQAQAHGVPAVVVTLVETMIAKLDLPHLIAAKLHSLDVEALVSRGLTMLMASLTKKAV